MVLVGYLLLLEVFGHPLLLLLLTCHVLQLEMFLILQDLLETVLLDQTLLLLLCPGLFGDVLLNLEGLKMLLEESSLLSGGVTGLNLQLAGEGVGVVIGIPEA